MTDISLSLVQIYDRSPIGWAIICYINVGIIVPCVVAILWYMGEKPILKRIIHRDTGVETGSQNTTGTEQNIVGNSV